MLNHSHWELRQAQSYTRKVCSFFLVISLNHLVTGSFPGFSVPDGSLFCCIMTVRIQGVFSLLIWPHHDSWCHWWTFWNQPHPPSTPAKAAQLSAPAGEIPHAHRDLDAGTLVLSVSRHKAWRNVCIPVGHSGMATCDPLFSKSLVVSLFHSAWAPPIDSGLSW